MPQITDSFTQIPPNSTGQQVRLLQLTVLDSGVPTTVVMEVASIADEFGNPLIWGDQLNWQQDMLDELRAIRLLMTELVSDGNPRYADNPIEDARSLQTDPDALS